jgi:hypothetical protein
MSQIYVTYEPQVCHICATFMSHMCLIYVTFVSHLCHICVKRTSPICQMYNPYVPRECVKMYVPYVPCECHMCVTSSLYMCHIYITSITHTSRASRDPFQSVNLNSKGKFLKHIYSCNFAIKASTLDTTRHFHPRVCTFQLLRIFAIS